MRKGNVVLKLVVSMLLVASVIFLQSQNFVHQSQVFRVLEDNPLYAPNAKVLKNVSLGFDNLLTDLIWLRTVQYIGGNAAAQNFPILYQYLDALTDLDPQFYMPYFVAQILLPEMGEAEKAVLISEKGLKTLPENWKIPYYLGFIYYFHLNDYERGAEMYDRASQIPGVLSSAQRMAINLRSKAGKHLLALDMWIGLYEVEKNESVKDLIAQKIQREKNFVELENLVKKYYLEKGFYPTSLGELKAKKWLEEIPVDPIENWKQYQIQDGKIVLE